MKWVPLLFSCTDENTDIWQSYIICQSHKACKSQGWDRGQFCLLQIFYGLSSIIADNPFFIIIKFYWHGVALQ